LILKYLKTFFFADDVLNMWNPLFLQVSKKVDPVWKTKHLKEEPSYRFGISMIIAVIYMLLPVRREYFGQSFCINLHCCLSKLIFWLLKCRFSSCLILHLDAPS